MAPIDFINKIRFNDDALCNSLMKFDGVIGSLSADDESELDREVEADLHEQSLQAADNLSQNDSSIVSDFDDIEPTAEGSCITCLTSMACMLYLPCTHVALCTECHEVLRTTHEERVTRSHSSDSRTLRSEIKKLKCPNCNEVIKQTIKIRQNSFR